VLFSPAYFAQYWAEGHAFSTAVQMAYDAEIERWKEIDIGGITYTPSTQELEHSEMIIKGTNPGVTIGTIMNAAPQRMVQYNGWESVAHR